MTSLSDGLGPQKHPNSGRTRVESGPAGPHRPTTRRGSAIGQHADVDVGPSHRAIASSAGAEGAGADPRRNGDDYPMTSLSDGLGPQKDPNSGQTRRPERRSRLWPGPEDRADRGLGDDGLQDGVPPLGAGDRSGQLRDGRDAEVDRELQ